MQKLDVEDLQFENMRPFDGTMAYAQNKRQQVVMTEQYAQSYPNVHFSCMHPGWADTPGIYFFAVCDRNFIPKHYFSESSDNTPLQGSDNKRATHIF